MVKLYQYLLASSALALSPLVLAMSNGVYTISTQMGDQTIEVTDALTDDGDNVALGSHTGNDEQQWIITAQTPDTYAMINLNSGKALEVAEASKANGANIEQSEFTGSPSQLWRIQEDHHGVVQITNVNSGLSLNVSHSPANHTNIEQWRDAGQQWHLTKTGKVQAGPTENVGPNLIPQGETRHWLVTGSLVTHDPTMTYQHGMWWEFHTGDGIGVKYSQDGLTWNATDTVFPDGLSWWTTYVPGNDGLDVWAPDVKFYNGKAWMYYAISTFGSNTSAIGLASTDDIADMDWEDDGLVINTTADDDDYNAIDPDLVVAKDGAPWLVFGSWFSGIKLTRLNPETMKPIGDIYDLAVRSGGIEAPNIVYHGGYYYLFVSIGICCEGVDSTYQIAYGRAKNITGPYLNKDGDSMLDGDVEIFDSGSDRWVGPGGQDIVGTRIIVNHAYDANDDGNPKLLISNLNWTKDGWPTY